MSYADLPASMGKPCSDFESAYERKSLETVIKAEIGVDDGREMPDVPNVDWKIDSVDL